MSFWKKKTLATLTGSATVCNPDKGHALCEGQKQTELPLRVVAEQGNVAKIIAQSLSVTRVSFVIFVR